MATGCKCPLKTNINPPSLPALTRRESILLSFRQILKPLTHQVWFVSSLKNMPKTCCSFLCSGIKLDTQVLCTPHSSYKWATISVWPAPSSLTLNNQNAWQTICLHQIFLCRMITDGWHRSPHVFFTISPKIREEMGEDVEQCSCMSTLFLSFNLLKKNPETYLEEFFLCLFHW